MSQFQLTEYFLQKYEENPEAYYTPKTVAKDLGMQYRGTCTKIKRLFLFGYLVTRYQPLRQKSFIFCEAGFQYKLNPAKVNSLRLVLKTSKQSQNIKDNPEQKNTNISVKKSKENTKVIEA